MTAPRGGLVVIFDGASGKVLQAPAIADCAGALPLAGGGFMISSGQGGLYRVRADQSDAEPLASTDLYWDNHFIV